MIFKAILLATCAILATGGTALAQGVSPSDQLTVPLAQPAKDTTYWAKSLKVGANLTQATFSDNWKAGGTNNLSFTALLNAKADYLRDRHTFRSEIDFQYGAVNNAGQGFRKSLDRLFVDTKYGYGIAKSWSLYSSVNLLSQFAQGFAYKDSAGETRARLLSQFFSPAYLTESFGFEYKPADYFFLRFGTGTLRQTFVIDTTLYRNTPDQKNYGVPIGRRVRNEFALQVMGSFDRDIAKNINLKARYIGFYNYRTLGDPRTWDHRVEAIVLAKVNKYISASVSSILIYDQDADPDVQFSYQLGLGLLATFGGINKN